MEEKNVDIKRLICIALHEEGKKLTNVDHEKILLYLRRSFLNHLEKDVSISSCKALKASPSKVIL